MRDVNSGGKGLLMALPLLFSLSFAICHALNSQGPGREAHTDLVTGVQGLFGAKTRHASVHELAMQRCGHISNAACDPVRPQPCQPDPACTFNWQWSEHLE
eukprot:1155150-Pelagomonas_calceolata.AAC.10